MVVGATVVVVVVVPLLYVTRIRVSNCLDIFQSNLDFWLHPICCEGIAIVVNFIFYAGPSIVTVPEDPLYFKAPASTYIIPPPVRLAVGAVPFCIRNLSALINWK